MNSKLAAFALLGMLNSTYQWYNAAGSNSREDITGIVQRIFLQGMLGNACKDQHTAKAVAH